MAVGSDIRGRLMTAVAVGMLVAVLGGCSAGPASTPPAPSPTASAAQSITGSRPSSPAIVRIVSPTPNQVIAGTTVHVVLQLQNAKIGL